MSRKPTKVTSTSKARKPPAPSRREKRASTTQRSARGSPAGGVSGQSRARRGGVASPETPPAHTRERTREQLPLPHMPTPAPPPPPAPKPGRPTGYSPELARKLCQLVSLGVPVSVACASERVSRSTLYAWRQAGKAGTAPYVEFAADLAAAFARAESAITVHVVTAAENDWRAGAWWLERRRPERYGAKQTVKLEKAAALMSEAELDAAIALYGYVRADASSEPATQEPHDPA
jgi:hypothetical protein